MVLREKVLHKKVVDRRAREARALRENIRKRLARPSMPHASDSESLADSSLASPSSPLLKFSKESLDHG